MTIRSRPVHPLTLISARIDRAITPGEARFLDAHMPTCETCQQQDASLREICAMLEAQPVPAAPARAIERLIEGLRENPTPQAEVVEPTPAPSAKGSAVKPWMMIVSALLVLTVVAVVTGMRQRPPAPPAGSVPEEFPSFPTSMTGSPPSTCAADSEAPTNPSTTTVEISEPPALPAPAPAPVRAARRPSRPAAAVTTPLAASTRSAASATSDAPPVVIQPDADAAGEPAPVDPERFEASSIYFGGNGKSLNKQSRRTLDDVAAWMQSHRDVRLVIEARTDPRKSLKKTLELGHKRALAVARYLEKKGVEPFRLRQEAFENPTSRPGDRVDLVQRR